MSIFQRFDGKWIFTLGTVDTETVFDTQLEAQTMATKLALATALVKAAQQIAPVMDAAGDLMQEYFDSGVTFVDDDVAALGLTAAQVTALVTLLENYNKFFGGSSPTNAQYRVSVNAVRRASV